MKTSTTYFVLYSNTSRRPQVMWTFAETIVAAADCELTRAGASLEDMAGVEWVEDADGNMHPARELAYEEVLALSIAKLGDDGRLYTTFSTDEAGAEAFIEAAGCHFLDDQARAIVEKFNS